MRDEGAHAKTRAIPLINTNGGSSKEAKRNGTIGWIVGKRTENATEQTGEKVDEGERCHSQRTQLWLRSSAIDRAYRTLLTCEERNTHA